MDHPRRRPIERVIILGLTPETHATVVAKFWPLLARGGRLLLAFGQPLSPHEISALAAAAPEPVGFEVYHGAHIAENGPIPSSVFVVSRLPT